MLTNWIKTYNVPTGTMTFQFDYDNQYRELDFDVIKVAKFKYGYEDDDALTFYPNSVTMEFDDPYRFNYEVLKLSIGQFNNTFPENYGDYSGVSIWHNRALKFKGYINPLTLEYKDSDRTVSFEVVDRSRGLNDMSLELPDGWTGQAMYGLGELVHEIYKKVFPDLDGTIYTSRTFTNGIYVNHDWTFKGKDLFSSATASKDWSVADEFNQVAISWNYYTNLWGADRPASTYRDMIKLLALQFGMTIGALDYNKIYLVKRFNVANTSPTNINDILVEGYKRTLHLNVMHGVRITNHWHAIGGGERTFTAGTVETINSEGELRYPNLVKQFDTYIGQYDAPWVQSNIYVLDGGVKYMVYTYAGTDLGVYDPVLGYRGHISNVICNWTYQSRLKPKDRIECELYGTDFELIDFLTITDPIYPSIIFRPMTLEKDYLGNKTSLTGIEV